MKIHRNNRFLSTQENPSLHPFLIRFLRCYFITGSSNRLYSSVPKLSAEPKQDAQPNNEKRKTKLPPNLAQLYPDLLPNPSKDWPFTRNALGEFLERKDLLARRYSIQSLSSFPMRFLSRNTHISSFDLLQTAGQWSIFQNFMLAQF